MSIEILIPHVYLFAIVEPTKGSLDVDINTCIGDPGKRVTFLIMSSDKPIKDGHQIHANDGRTYRIYSPPDEELLDPNIINSEFDHFMDQPIRRLIQEDAVL